FQRFDLQLVREFVHVCFTGEVVRSGCERAVGTLLERRVRVVKLNDLIWDVVEWPDRGAARIVVMKLPRRERTVFSRAAGHFDQASGSEVGPRHLLLPRPHNLYWLARGLCEARGFGGGFHTVLS